MSTVYSALDERLDRPVAVKVMSAALSTDPAFADRFAREARVAARLSHLSAVAVYDQGTDDGHVFLVMELVTGRTLRDLLRERGALPPALAVSILEPVLGALAAAHRAGLVHRDVKPENILLADDGAVKVADFGLARAVEADQSSTRTGLMMGTVAYCPPEQISRGSADARSDVYSAGVVLFELLTGAAPYAGDSAMAVAYQHVHSDMPPPSSRRPGIPAQLDELVLRATHRDPAGRPLDAGAMLAELHDARIDLGLPVVPVPPRPHVPAAGASASDTQRIARLPEAGTAAPGPITATSTTAPHPARPAGDLQHTTIQERDRSEPAAAGRPGTGDAAGRRRRSRRRGAVVVAIVLLLGLLTGYGAWYLAVGRYHRVPEVAGSSRATAVNLLRGAGFTVDPAIDQAYSETTAAGMVLGSEPDAGSHLLSGHSVRLVISRGAERFVVPQVAGRDYAAAQQAFAGMPVRLVRRNTADGTGKIAPGQVIRTDPGPTAKVKRDATVTVYVSTGPPIVAVPDVVNRSQDDANSALTGAGFKVDVRQDYSDTVPAGTVISQDPAARSSVAKFSTVNLVVSQGPKLVTLPQIRNGTPLILARNKLEGLHLKVKVKRAFGGFLDTVVGMDPGAGTQVREGSEVVLTVV
ncbi:MAG: eukaryotic-like serine/threonine-protein kinase [Pseudonocardiales bacterium]|nr:eukaryotic-like serine/threonine-protein kinase [Pseudonocardiales bacterium]